MAYEDFDALARSQAGQSRQVGARAADIADPFSSQRGQYQNQLNTLMQNPGSFASSPTYQFAFNQGLDALNRRAAATGKTGSGNYLADLMKYGQGMASQQYFNQANLLAKLAGVDSSSPAAAALALTGGFNRGQDQESIGAVARALRGGSQQGGGAPNWLQIANQELDRAFPRGGSGGGTGLPSGGYSIPAAYSPYTGPGYLPSEGAGTGYVQSDYGTTEFGAGGDMYYPSSGTDLGYGGGYDAGSFDAGGYDYGGYDYGAEEY